MSKSTVNNELYKFTDEYKESSLNSALIRQYIFKAKPPELHEAKDPDDGSLYFIDSDMLYDGRTLNDYSGEQKIKYQIRSYFKYNSLNGRYLNSNVRVCNIPTNILDKDATGIINNLSRNVDLFMKINRIYKNGHIDEKIILASDFESVKIKYETEAKRKEEVGETGNYITTIECIETGTLKDLGSSGDLYPDIFGIQFSSSDFFKYSGIMISIYKVVKETNRYRTLKIPINDKIHVGFDDNGNSIYDSNIKLSVMSSNYFDIEFTDYNPKSEYYIIEILKSVSGFDYNIEPENNYMTFGEIRTSNQKSRELQYILNIDPNYLSHEFIKFGDSEFYKYGLTAKSNNIQVVDITDDMVHLKVDLDQFEECKDYINNRYISSKQLLVWLIFEKSWWGQYLITRPDYSSNLLLQSYYDIDGHLLSIKVPRKMIEKYIQTNNGSYILAEPTISITLFDDSEISYKSEKNINDILEDYGLERTEIMDASDYSKYFPQAFRHSMEKQSETYIDQISAIHRSFIVNYVVEEFNGPRKVPCILLEIPMKHSSVMLFQNGLIIEPYAYFEGHHEISIYDANENIIKTDNDSKNGNMYLYIEISKLVDIDQYETFLNGSSKSLKLTHPIDIVISNGFFEEDVRFPLYVVKKYFPKDSKTYYYDYENDEYVEYIEGDTYHIGTHVKSDTGEFLPILFGKLYNQTKREIKSTEESEVYDYIYTEDSNGDYIAASTNEYLIPVNKHLDLNNIVIVAEEMVEYDYDEKDEFNIPYTSDEDGYYYSARFFDYEDPVATNEYKSFIKADTQVSFDGLYQMTSDGNVTKYTKLSDVTINDGVINTTLNLSPYVSNDNLFLKILIADYSEKTVMIRCKIAQVRISGEPLYNVKPTKYRRGHYKYSNILNNVEFSTIKGERGLIEKPTSGEDNSKPYLPDKDLINQFDKFNNVIKIKIKGGEIIDCGFPTTDEYINAFDCGLEYVYPDDDIYNPTKYDLIDLNTASVETIEDGKILAFNISNGYSRYHFNKEDEKFLSYIIPDQLINSEGKMMIFVDGKYTDEFEIAKYIYYRLFNGDTILSISDDQTSEENIKYKLAENGDYRYPNTSYNKIRSNVFVTNLGNYTLYQDINGLSYSDGVFELSNDLSSFIINEQKMYSDIYMVPLSTKYMLMFINGKYIDPEHIKILSDRRFALVNTENYFDSSDYDDDGNLVIYEFYLYRYDYINPLEYVDSYYLDPVVTKLCQVHGLRDYLWENYGDDITIRLLDDSTITRNVIIKPKDTGYHRDDELHGLYEIFGKYVLNSYDLDNDFEAIDEIRSYFNLLFDDDGRMKLELLDDDSRRKYEYM